MTMSLTPAAHEFTSINERIVWPAPDAAPDAFGRIQFTAFWLEDYLTPAGVRGQVFFTDLDQWAGRSAGRGFPVRVVSA